MTDTQECWQRQRAAPENIATRALLVAHGLYYLLGGAWPVLSIRSFEAVTGPKKDKWLVKTTGLLVAVIGGTLARAAQAEKTGCELKFLAIGSAASLALVDIFYVSRRRIPPVYLCDALAELVLITAWRGKICARSNSK